MNYNSQRNIIQNQQILQQQDLFQNPRSFYKSLVSFNKNQSNSQDRNKILKTEFNNTLTKSQTYNFKMIQQPENNQGQGFQSFKSIIQEIEKSNYFQQNDQQDQITTAKELILCLNYNKQQKVSLESSQTSIMRQSFDNLKSLYKYKKKELHCNDKYIKQKPYDQNSEEQIYIPIKQNEFQFTSNKKQINQLYAYLYSNNLQQMPPTLYGACLVNYQNKLYLLGGRSSQINNQIFELNLQYWKWNIVPQQSKFQFQNRFGHQIFVYGQGIYVFGGENKFNQNLKIRECSNDLLYFDLHKYQWSIIQTSNSPEARRNFASCLVGNKYFMIYGGVNPHGQYLKDTHFLNLDTFNWETYNIQNDIEGEIGISFHTMIYIQKTKTKINSLFQQTIEYRHDNILNKIKDDSIITFGGKSNNESSFENLKQCKIGYQQLKWQNMQSQGQPPDRRHSHSMNFLETTQQIIIFGGVSLQTNQALKDLFCIHIQNLQWFIAIYKIYLLFKKKQIQQYFEIKNVQSLY